MKKLLKKLSTLLLAGMIVIGCVSLQTQEADALTKYVKFVGKSGNTLKVKASVIGLYRNAVFKANSSEADYMYRRRLPNRGGRKVVEKTKCVSGYFIKLDSFYGYEYNKYDKKYYPNKFVYVQYIDKVGGSLNGEPVFVLDKSCSDHSGKYCFIMEDRALESVSRAQYVTGKNDGLGRCWTPKSISLREFCKNNNITKIRVTYW